MQIYFLSIHYNDLQQKQFGKKRVRLVSHPL